MTTIYVVVSGDEDDGNPEIEALFSTLEHASRFQQESSKCWSGVRILEYVLDEHIATLTETRYRCCIDLLTGSIERLNSDRTLGKTGGADYEGVIPEVQMSTSKKYGPWCSSVAYAWSYVSPEDAEAKALELKADFERTVLTMWRVTGRQTGPYLNLERIEGT